MKRLLIVGSHEVVRAGLKAILDAQSEITFGEANTASEAFELLQQQEWDAVVFDLSLGERSTLEVQNRLMEIRPKLPILVLGTLSDPEYARRLFKVGVSGYVTKDSPSAELVTAVSKIVKGGKYVSPALAERIIGYLAPGSPPESMKCCCSSRPGKPSVRLLSSSPGARKPLAPTARAYWTR